MNLKSHPKENESSALISRLVIFTCILYRKDFPEWLVRFNLFKEALERAESLWLSVVAVDDGTDSLFIDELRSFQNLHIIPGYTNDDQSDSHNKMSASRRFAAREAMKLFPNKEFLLYTVPEKVDLIKEESLVHIVSEMVKNQAMAAVIGRSDFLTLPIFQRLSEIRGNHRLMQILSGGRDFSKNSLPHSLTPDDFYDFFFWVGILSYEWIKKYYLPHRWDKWSEDSIPLMLAMWAKEKVLKILIDFSYPSLQTEFEQWEDSVFYKRKRLVQFRSILTQAKREFIS